MNTAGGMEGFSKYFDWPLIKDLEVGILVDVILTDYDGSKLAK